MKSENNKKCINKREEDAQENTKKMCEDRQQA